MSIITKTFPIFHRAGNFVRRRETTVTPSQIEQVIRLVKRAVRQWETPTVIRMGREKQPFRILVSCILSLRTRDAVTDAAARRLFALADTPDAMLGLDLQSIEKAIYPAAFYRMKSKTLHSICRRLLENYGGRVPDSIDDLLKFKGVGRKTANLTVILGYGKPGICVDTHVHRIANRWGYVATRSPDATEQALRKKLPKKFWKELNGLLVAFGQNVCKPLSPLCDSCCVAGFCKRVGVRQRQKNHPSASCKSKA